MRHKSLLVLAVLLALAPACSKDKARAQKLASLCVEAGDQLATDGSHADDKTFKLMLANAFEACSGACDAGDQPSCKHLDEHVAKVCKVAPGICKSMCESVHSPSLKQRTCAFSK